MINGKGLLMLGIFASVLSEDPFGEVEYYLLEEDIGDDQETAQENEGEEGYAQERTQDNELGDAEEDHQVEEEILQENHEVEEEKDLQGDHRVDEEENLQEDHQGKGAKKSQKKKPVKVESDGCSFQKKMQVNKSDVAKTKAQISMEDLADIKILSCMVNGNEIDYSFDGTVLTVEDSFEAGENILDLFVFDGAGNICRMEAWKFCL